MLGIRRYFRLAKRFSTTRGWVAGDSGSGARSIVQAQKHPNSYMGIHTRYGWGLIPIDLSSKQSDIKESLWKTFGDQQIDKIQLQLSIDSIVEENHHPDIREKIEGIQTLNVNICDIDTLEVKSFELLRKCINLEINNYLKSKDLQSKSSMELKVRFADQLIDKGMKQLSTELRKIQDVTESTTTEVTTNPELTNINQNNTTRTGSNFLLDVVTKNQECDRVSGKVFKNYKKSTVNKAQGLKYFRVSHLIMLSTWPTNIVDQFIRDEWNFLSEHQKSSYADNYLELEQNGYTIHLNRLWLIPNNEKSHNR